MLEEKKNRMAVVRDAVEKKEMQCSSIIGLVVQRVKDVLRELRIRLLVSRITAAEDSGNEAGARLLCRSLYREINARSPRAVARLERARGLA